MVIDARDDATLADLYRGATAVAVPSTYEGFGLPLLVEHTGARWTARAAPLP